MLKRIRKRIVLISAVVAAIAAMVVSTAATTAVEPTIAMVVKLQKYLVGSQELTVEESENYDLNADECINAFDYAILKQMLINHTQNPVETTTTSTTTETTTTTTATAEANPLANYDLSDILEKITLDIEVPVLNDDSVYEEKEYIYAFEVSGIKYAYTLLLEEQPETTAPSSIMTPEKIKGIHMWIYTGDEDVVDATNLTLPSTAGKTFTYQDKQYSYKLYEYSSIRYLNIQTVCDILSGNYYMGQTGYTAIQRYDYNLNGTIDNQDLQIMLTYYVTYPELAKPIINSEYFGLMIGYAQDMGLTNFVIMYSSDIVEYSITVPTQEYVDSNNLEFCFPMQIVSNSYYEQFVNEFGEQDSVANSDFIIWCQNYYGGNPDMIAVWRTVEELEWTSTGFYALAVDETGNYITGLYPNA